MVGGCAWRTFDSHMGNGIWPGDSPRDYRGLDRAGRRFGTVAHHRAHDGFDRGKPHSSAPVALVAGAAYGHVAGAVYVAIGSELGALVAFIIARYIGRDHVERWLGDKAGFGLLGSQNLLMLTVFASRLLPFISFDAMSYAAGLSRLRLWRFLIATLAGILPASFLLAHFGAEAMSGDFGTAEWIIIGLGLMTAAPLLVAALWRTNRSTNAS